MPHSNDSQAAPSHSTASTPVTRHPVVFVGAGPGDPELITVKGQRALQEADLVIYAGSLVPEALLQWTRPGTEIRNSAAMNLEEIVAAIRQAHEAEKRVVRLHTGDPSLYGAILEQMVALNQAGVAYQVIPGVTAAFAAAASMGIEYTLPEISQTLILTRMAGRTPVPEKEALESLAAHQASMAIYLSITLIEQVAEILIRAYGGDSLCAVAFRVSQPDEKIHYTPLNDLVRLVRDENITHQALIIVGKVLKVAKTSLQDGSLTSELKSRLYDRQFSHGYRKAKV
jgi:precorrin-4/cobalt-precorrin-4 C11-methyltransferase